MESLRVLADSRDEPLRSEMLRLLAEEETSISAAGDDMVFFMVSDEDQPEEVTGDIIDFDVMAADFTADGNQEQDDSGRPEVDSLQEIEEIAAEPAQAGEIGQKELNDSLREESRSRVAESEIVSDIMQEQTTVCEVASETEGQLDETAASALAEEKQLPEEPAASAAASAVAVLADEAVAMPDAAQTEEAEEEAPTRSGETSVDYLPDSVLEVLEEPNRTMQQALEAAKKALQQAQESLDAKQPAAMQNVEAALPEETAMAESSADEFAAEELFDANTYAEPPAAEDAQENLDVRQLEAMQAENAAVPEETAMAESPAQEFAAEKFFDLNTDAETPAAEKAQAALSEDEKNVIELLETCLPQAEQAQDTVLQAETVMEQEIEAKDSAGEMLLQPVVCADAATAGGETAAESASAEKKETAAARKRRRRAERRQAEKERKAKMREEAAQEAAEPFPSLPVLFLPDCGEQEDAQADAAVEAENAWEAPNLSHSYDMIPAYGSLDLTMAMQRALDLAGDEAEIGADTGDAAANALTPYSESVDCFSEPAHVIRLFAAEEEELDWETDDEPEPGFSGTLLLMNNETAAVGQEKEEIPAAGETLPPLARLSLIKALAGGDAAVYEESEDKTDAAAQAREHVILQPAAEEPGAMPDQSLLEELENDYQTRLDAFAARLLEVQAVTAESELKLREQAALLEDKDKALVELDEKLAVSEKAMREMAAEMAQLSDSESDKKREVERLAGLQEEHQRLYHEFEDLRKAYNEVVTEVMPSLQNERDELVLTVEKQGEDEEQLRSALKSSGRRITVGYSLAAAATIMMVVLPLTHWLRSGDSAQNLAMGKQKTSELLERLDKAERRNVEAEKTIFDLERQANLAMLEVSKLEKANNELAAVTDKRTREVAELKAGLAGGSASARTALAAGEDMALSGPASRNGKLRVNQVRDPGGSIHQVLAQNRERYAREDAVMASASGKRANSAIQISAVAKAPGQRNQPQAAANAKNNAAQEKSAAGTGQLAVVKRGEGVAQVVYRTMGTRDPEVIAWVIKENNIKKDRRGNPRIYPDQKLRLPGDEILSIKSASAARR